MSLISINLMIRLVSGIVEGMEFLPFLPSFHSIPFIISIHVTVLFRKSNTPLQQTGIEEKRGRNSSALPSATSNTNIFPEGTPKLSPLADLTSNINPTTKNSILSTINCNLTPFTPNHR